MVCLQIVSQVACRSDNLWCGQLDLNDAPMNASFLFEIVETLLASQCTRPYISPMYLVHESLERATQYNIAPIPKIDYIHRKFSIIERLLKTVC